MRRRRQKRPRLAWLNAGIPGDWKWPLVSLLVVAGSAAVTLALLIGIFRLLS